jgi:hypothetical protein
MQVFYWRRRGLAAFRGSTLAVIIVLIILAGIILYFLDLPSRLPKKDPNAVGLEPWEEWRIREKQPGNDRGKPSEYQPELSEIIEFSVDAQAKDVEHTPRGTVSLVVQPDGTVSGGWGGNYYNDRQINFDGGGGVSGYVCPSKIYGGGEEEDEEDESKLYFITKGEFVLHETDFEKSRFHIRGGDLYITGWINADYTAFGEVTITSDEKYYERFHWEVTRPPI